MNNNAMEILLHAILQRASHAEEGEGDDVDDETAEDIRKLASLAKDPKALQEILGSK